MTLGPELCPGWIEHLAEEVTGLPTPPLHPQEAAVSLGGSAMALESIVGEKTLKDDGEVTPFGECSGVCQRPGRGPHFPSP